jgi:hypothetical protein
MLRRLQALNITKKSMPGEILKQVQDDHPSPLLGHFLNAPDHSAILLRLDYGGPCRKVIASLLLLSTSPLLPLSGSPPQVFWYKKLNPPKADLKAGPTDVL